MFADEAYDALVVGARCAGAATAMLMARQGMRVLVIDRGGYGTDSISTHALMRGGVLQLHRWGILPRIQEADTPPVKTTTFHYGDEAITVAIKPSNGVNALYAPRRTLLDRTLVDAARSAGAVVRHGHALISLTYRSDGRVCGATVLDAARNILQVQADIVVGADGIGSSVARLVGAETLVQARHRPRSYLAISQASSCQVTIGGSGQGSAPAPFQPTVVDIVSSLPLLPSGYETVRHATTALHFSRNCCDKRILLWQTWLPGASRKCRCMCLADDLGSCGERMGSAGRSSAMQAISKIRSRHTA